MEYWGSTSLPLPSDRLLTSTDLECKLIILCRGMQKLITRGSLVAALLSAMGYLSFAFLLDCPADTPYIHLYLTAAYFCVGAATVGSYFACLTTGKLMELVHVTHKLSIQHRYHSLLIPLYHSPSPSLC